MVQDLQIGECIPPPDGDRDSYTRDLDDFDGVPEFFLEWRVQTDGDRSEIDGGAPALLSAGSFGPVTYHFTIARDRVKFVRDAFAEIVFLDLEQTSLA